MKKLKVNFSYKTRNFINAFLVENKQNNKKIITANNLNLVISIANRRALLSLKESLPVYKETVQEGF